MRKILVLTLSLPVCVALFADDDAKAPDTIKNYPTTIDYQERLALHESHRKIAHIHVQGNQVISNDSILHRLPIAVLRP